MGDDTTNRIVLLRWQDGFRHGHRRDRFRRV